MLYRTLSAPISVQLEITTRCNNKCIHCYNYWRQIDEQDYTLSKQNIGWIIRELSKNKVFSVTVTGGEPLLYPDLVAEAIRLCSIYKIDCSLNTNLTLLNEKILNKLLDSGKFGILTSLASYKEDVHDFIMNHEGSFQKTVRSIKLLNQKKVPFSINMVILKHNENDVYETGKLAVSMGARCFSATKASPPIGCRDFSSIRASKESIKASFDTLLQLKEEFGIIVDALECYPLCFFGNIEKYQYFSRRNCSAATTSATIGANGQVRPCSHSDRVYGSIFSYSLGKIWLEMGEWRTGELVPKLCIECEYLNNCSGGCRVEAQCQGDICGMDPFATSPKDVISYERTHSITRNFSKKCFLLDPNIRIRYEKFGSIIANKRSRAMIDKKATKALEMIKNAPLNIEEISKRSGYPSDLLYSFFDSLSNMGLISESET